MARTSASNAFTVVAEEEAHRDHQATEALLFTFNSDLGFFEARLLGLLRATGARVTVIADAGVWNPDTRAVQHAGRSYHLGLCDTASAFHPKLLVLAGPKRAIATVGSGNLTMGGWQYNHELLTVIHGDEARMPAAFADIRDLLGSLAATRNLDRFSIAAVQRTTKVIDGLIAVAANVDTGHRVHASWDGDLLSTLPAGPVEELSLFAAFHDPAAVAVRRIIDRMRPRHVRVCVQPGWTSVNPAALQRVLDQHAEEPGSTWELLRDPASGSEPESRYRHGKLIEWLDSGCQRYALTGSPNLSFAALLANPTRGGHGNYEVAVIGPCPESLFPGGTPLAFDDLPEPEPQDDDTDRTASVRPVRVTSAHRTKDQETEVRLNRGSPAEVTIEVSLHSESPDIWAVLGHVSSGLADSTFNGALPAGTRVRALTWDPKTETAEPTAPIYVTDPERILARSIPEAKRSRTHRAVAADLFGDDIALLDSLQDDLAAFASDLANARQPSAPGEAVAREDAQTESHEVKDSEPWLWLQDRAVRRYGPGLATWLLALPHLHSHSAQTPEVAWLDKINPDNEVGLDSDEVEAATQEVAANESQPEPDTIDHRTDPHRIKLERQRWATRAVAVAPDIPVLSRIFILRLTLTFWSAGNWSKDAFEPYKLVRNLIRSLSGQSPQTDEVTARVTAAIAVALTVMDHRVERSSRNHQTLMYLEAIDACVADLQSFDSDVLDAYVVGLRNRYGGPLSTEHVMDLAATISADDPLAAVQVDAEARGYTVTRPSRNHITISGEFSNPEQFALATISTVEESDSAALWAINPQGHWTLVAWNRPDLVTVSRRGGIAKWRHQRLRIMGLRAVADALRHGGPGALPDVVHSRPKHSPTPAAQAVLDSLDVTDLHPPTSPAAD